MTQPRIAQLANFVGPTSGGMKHAVNALGAGYVEAGVDRVLVVPGSRDLRYSTEHGDVVQLRAPKFGNGYRLIVEPWRVAEALDAFAPTSVEVSDKLTLLPVARWARRNDVRSVLFSHERLDAMLALRTRRPTTSVVSIGALNRILVRQFDSIVVTSRYALGEFAAPAARVGTPIHQVALGVDLELFHPAAHRPPAGPLRLALVGRLSREKSPHLAVATAVELHRRGVPLQLDVYGDGPHRGELEQLVGSAPVVFHGHVASRPHLAARIARADIALSVCPAETFGLAVLEALAAGTPVVTADEGGARELVDESCGEWGRPEAGALADAVLRLAARPRASTREAARYRAELFPWKQTVEAMLAVHTGGQTATGVRSRRPA
ncbi:glycosyltransferase [Nocardioides mangrovi]|uniref:Glycosyltransferase n=1 Tax=Nocardioides mangrovi TaxID=2874580 RepID=A0ABS7UAU6_9ACTN|nr:glycosyltransferase [Nocardioides mangrovi]MBZ5738123.1 glycosyltransferase [Nocardioides mangrovi]